jgi:hypothetical protein
MTFVDTLDLLEQRVLGIIAWLVAHENQMNKMISRTTEMKHDMQTVFIKVQAMKKELKGG